MTFRTYICALACAAAFSPSAAHALDKKEWPVLSLQKENIMAFMEETKNVSMGKKAGLTPDQIYAYLDRHISSTGTFKSLTKFEIPGLPVKEVPMSFDKQQYIENILNGQNALEDYKDSIQIQDLQISMNGKTARLKTVSTESGRMDWPDADGVMKKVPVEGTSTCLQNIAISAEQAIVMMDANCDTTIKFKAFSKPLGEQ